MAIKFSIQDKIGAKFAPALRCINDIKIDLSGSKASVLRIIRSAPQKETETDWVDLGGKDVFGNFEQDYQTEVIDNVVITYPFSNIELFERLNDGSYESNPVEAIDLFEFLPITMKVKFNGNYGTTINQLQKGDLIIDIIKNDTNGFIPVVLQITRLRGSLSRKQLVNRPYELSLYRGGIESRIQTKIDQFVSDYETEWNAIFGTQTNI